MKKIERPDFKYILKKYNSTIVLSKLDDWFDENIVPINKMLEDAVEVYGFKNENTWKIDNDNEYDGWTAKAILTNIQPIKKETAEDILRELLPALKDLKDAYYERVSKRIEELINET